MIRILQQDNRATKAIFAVIIGAAIVTMVITLVPGIFDNGAPTDSTVYATVRAPGFFSRFGGDTTSIKLADVQREAQQQLSQQHLPPAYLPFIMPRIEQRDVERAVLGHEADRLGLQASDADVRRELQKGPLSQYLFPNGNFIGDDRYIDFVQEYFGISVPQFETEVKSDIELQRLQALVTGGVTVSDAAVRASYMQQGTKVKFDYAVISADDIKKTINPTDAELQTFFKQNSARYAGAIPETRKIEFFSFDNSNLPGGPPAVTPAEVQAYYSAHQADFKVPQEVKTRHILITVPKGAPASVDAAAKAKAEDLLKQIKGGANFADLAKKYSDDPGSKTQGGELPMIPTSSLDPAYAKAAMALAPGQTSDVVRSQFGYHIIQTEAKDEAHAKPLAEVSQTIQQQLAAQDASAAAQSYGNQLAQQAKTEGMAKTAAAHNLHLITTDFVARSGVIPSLPDSSALLTAAFNVEKGAAPQSTSTGDGYAVFQVEDVQAAHAPAFADWKSHVLEDYREQKAPELLNAQLIKLADSARSMHDLTKAAAAMNIPVKTSDFVGRDAQVTDLGSMSGEASVLFTLPKGGISGPINEGPNGSVAELVDKQEPSSQDLATNLPAAREKLLAQKRDEAFAVFAGTLMTQFENSGAVQYSRKQTGIPFGT